MHVKIRLPKGRTSRPSIHDRINSERLSLDRWPPEKYPATIGKNKAGGGIPGNVISRIRGGGWAAVIFWDNKTRRGRINRIPLPGQRSVVSRRGGIFPGRKTPVNQFPPRSVTVSRQLLFSCGPHRPSPLAFEIPRWKSCNRIKSFRRGWCIFSNNKSRGKLLARGTTRRRIYVCMMKGSEFSLEFDQTRFRDWA